MKKGNFKKQNRSALTLLELLIAIVIVGVLSFVSLFYYERYSLNAKRMEALTNLGVIRQLEEVYRTEKNRYVTCDWSPLKIPPPSGTKEWNDNSYFKLLGFRPMGALRYRYGVAKSNGNYTTDQCIADIQSCYNNSVVENDFVSPRDSVIDILVKAEGDLDDNGEVGKLFISDEPPEKIVNVDYLVF